MRHGKMSGWSSASASAQETDVFVRCCRSATPEWSIHNTIQISTLITNAI